MDDTTSSENSSLNELSVLDPDQYEEITQTTPTVHFLHGGLMVLETASDDDADDLSEYVLEAGADEEIEFPLEDSLLSPPKPESVTTDLSPIGEFLSLPEKIRSPSLQSGSDTKSLTQEVSENWNSVISGTIKEEIRYKIQLKRLREGREELKVDFTEPETTVCFEALKRRNEIREKNKEYAKQSRDRVKLGRLKLEQDNDKLREKNIELRKKITNLREKLRKTRTLFSRHHETCHICSKNRNDCCVCSKGEDTPKLFLSSGASSSIQSQPGPSGLSTVRINEKAASKLATGDVAMRSLFGKDANVTKTMKQ